MILSYIKNSSFLCYEDDMRIKGMSNQSTNLEGNDQLSFEVATGVLSK